MRMITDLPITHAFPALCRQGVDVDIRVDSRVRLTYPRPYPMGAKLCAMWFVLLSVLPFTAPFSICDAADFIGSDSADGEVGLTTHPSCSIADDTAMVSERSDFRCQSRQCAVVITASYHLVAVQPFVPPTASPTITATLPKATTVLQI